MILIPVWVAAAAIATGAALLLTHGTTAAAVAALLSTPLAVALGIATRALLRRSLARHELRMARAEGDALMRDPEFLESLSQMRRGEGIRARTRDEEEN